MIQESPRNEFRQIVDKLDGTYYPEPMNFDESVPDEAFAAHSVVSLKELPLPMLLQVNRQEGRFGIWHLIHSLKAHVQPQFTRICGEWRN